MASLVAILDLKGKVSWVAPGRKRRAWLTRALTCISNTQWLSTVSDSAEL